MLHAATIVEAFRIISDVLADQVAIGTKGDEQALTWRSGASVRTTWPRSGTARTAAGGDARDHLGNRPEFHVVDLGRAARRGPRSRSTKTFRPTRSSTSGRRRRRRALRSSSTRTSSLRLEALPALPHLEHVILIDPGSSVVGVARGPTSRPRAVIPRPRARRHRGCGAGPPEDALTLIYTFGTTGPPKGVELSHGDMMATVPAIERHRALSPGRARDLVAARRPISPSATSHHYLPIVDGWQITSCPIPRQVAPTYPRCAPGGSSCAAIWEKLKAGLERCSPACPPSSASRGGALEAVAEQPVASSGASRCLASWPPRRRGRRANSPPNCARCSASTSSTVVTLAPRPTPLEVLEFFHAIGIPLAELWGMSETCAAGSATARRIKLGTVGTLRGC